MVSLAERRRAVEYLQRDHAISERRGCRLVKLSRSTKRRPLGEQRDQALIQAIHACSQRYPRFGYRKIHIRLQGEGWTVGRERVRLIRRREGLHVVVKQRKRHRLGTSTADPTRARYPNQVWSYDFVHDQTMDGRRLRCLTVMDEYTREGIAIHTARSITSGVVIQVLQRLFSRHGAPDVYPK